MSTRLFLSTFLITCLTACSKAPSSVPQPAFYHWQTRLQLTGHEQCYLDSLGVTKLYVKFFDVDWDDISGQAVPHAAVEMDTTGLEDLEIVPTVFITNRTFLNLKPEEIPILADRIFEKITTLAQPLQSSHPSILQSFQFDCDWTSETRDPFFILLEHFREVAGKSSLIPHSLSLSATIRLHQFRYFDKTGVPPVDRGMLMCYNMGDLETWETENSILDPTLAKKYMIDGIRYPVPLDIALPLFHWGVLFRDGQLIKLINGLGEEDLQDPMRFMKIAPNRFQVRVSTYLQGYYLYEGDQLRLESVDADQLEVMVAYYNKLYKQPDLTVAFYHLDTGVIQSFPAGKLEKVLKHFQ